MSKFLCWNRASIVQWCWWYASNLLIDRFCILNRWINSNVRTMITFGVLLFTIIHRTLLLQCSKLRFTRYFWEWLVIMLPAYVMGLWNLLNFLMVNVSLVVKKIICINNACISWMLGSRTFLNIRQLNICRLLLYILIDRMPLYSGGNVLNERLPWVTGPIVDTTGKLDGLVFLLLEVIVSHW